MQTDDRTGIICDLCGMSYKDDFSYYSFDIKKVETFNNRYTVSLEQKLNSDTFLSLDVCNSCFDTIKNAVVNNYKATKLLYCEISGSDLSSTYYYVIVSHVSVKLSGRPSFCVACKTESVEKNAKCKKCGGDKFITPAQVNVNKRVVEFNISENEFNSFKSKSESVKQVQNKLGGWSSRST